MNFCLLFVSFCVFSRFIWICTLTVQKMKFFFGVIKKMGANAFCGLKCLEFSSRVYFWVFSYSMNSVQLLSMATIKYIVKNAKICKWYLMLCANLVQLNQHRRFANKSLKNVFANKAFYGFGYNKTTWKLFDQFMGKFESKRLFFLEFSKAMHKMDSLGRKICNLSLPPRNRCKLI